ncbi:MAG TPA: tetratricopeptide repeat-containing glycosyltransferase family protein [Tepidisphaeraceae bacterium]|jgi:tetratricopeptide (TPR) repeat protein
MSDPSIEQLMQMAMQFQAAGKLAEVESVCRQILARDSDYTPALQLLGALLGHTGRHEQAAEVLSRCVRLDPTDAAAQSTLGIALQLLGHPEKAIEHLSRAVELQPQAAQMQYNLGKALRDQKRMEEAAIAFGRTVELQRSFSPAWNNLGNTLRDLGRLEEAVTCYQTDLELRPNNPHTLHNMGITYRELLRLAEAMRCFDTALTFEPGYNECRLSRAMLLLLEGQLLRGWNEYESRFDVPRTKARREYTQPAWDGSDPEGRTILLYSEQGFGDAIQFVRYAPLLAQRNVTVIIECQPELRELFASLRGVEQVICPGDELPDFDAYRGMLSMPLTFGTTLETIPAEGPYLRADRAKVRRWRKIIEPGGLRVGLVWAGAAGYGNDRNRSLTLERISRFAQTPDIRFYGLQKGDAAKQALNPPEGMSVLDLSDELHDFSDTAAAIENLDLVISVDTAVGHLAGALGKSVWLMIPYFPDWRWMLGRVDSPWYPTMRLFRQGARGDWDGVIDRVAEELKTFAP